METKSLKNENKEQMLSLFRVMFRIREFEETAAKLFLDGKLVGFLHLYSGEEAIAAGVCACLRDDDCVTSTHRGHGHCIAKGADVNRMMAELYGKADGYSKGKGGSMHIADISKGIIGANGIVGAGMPIAVGAAFSLRYRKINGVAVSFFGDGASNRGTFHEAMNMASVWNLPLVFVCENNNFGMSTPMKEHMKAKKISQRSAAYDIPGVTVDGNDVVAVYEAAGEAIANARKGNGPTLLECMTWRHHGHFVGDPAPYKNQDDQKYWLANDPIPRFAKRLLEEGICSQQEVDELNAQAQAAVDAAIKFAQESPEPEPEELFADLYV